MNVAVEAVDRAQVAGHAHHAFHRVVGVTDDARGEEQPLDVVAAVEFDGQLGEFVGGEGGPTDVVAAPVDAVGAVEDADVREHDFKQRHAASVRRERVADAPACGVADAVRTMLARHAARCARDVVARRFGQYGELFEHGCFHGGKVCFFQQTAYCGSVFFRPCRAVCTGLRRAAVRADRREGPVTPCAAFGFNPAGSRTSAHKETALFVGTKSAAENCHPITPAGTGGIIFSYTSLPASCRR